MSAAAARALRGAAAALMVDSANYRVRLGGRGVPDDLHGRLQAPGNAGGGGTAAAFHRGRVTVLPHQAGALGLCACTVLSWTLGSLFGPNRSPLGGLQASRMGWGVAAPRFCLGW